MRWMKALIVAAGILVTSTQANAIPATVGSFNLGQNIPVNNLTDFSAISDFSVFGMNYGTLFDPNNWGVLFSGDTNTRVLEFEDHLIDTSPHHSELKAHFAQPIAESGQTYDVYAFESGSAPPTSLPENIQASLDGSSGSWISFAILGFVNSADIGGPTGTTGVYVFGLNLADLGVAPGVGVSALYIRNAASSIAGNQDPDIVYMTGVSAVPIPAALPLLASGLSALGVIGWRRRSRAA